MTTTAERLHGTVNRHGLFWTDIASRVVSNEGIAQDEANKQVARLITKEDCSLAVALAIIDMIVEQRDAAA